MLQMSKSRTQCVSPEPALSPSVSTWDSLTYTAASPPTGIVSRPLWAAWRQTCGAAVTSAGALATSLPASRTNVQCASRDKSLLGTALVRAARRHLSTDINELVTCKR